MGSVDAESKRARVGSYSGASQQRVQHVAEAPNRFASHRHPPTSAQTTYHESEQRELPDPLSHPFHGRESASQSYNMDQSAYLTRTDSIGAACPPDRAYPRPTGTPMKSRSPPDSSLPPAKRPLSVTTSNGPSSHPMSYPLDHPPLSASSAFAGHPSNGAHGHPMAAHDAMNSNHAGSYQPSPMSASPHEPYYGNGSGMNGPVVTTFPARRKAIRAAQACDQCRQRKAKCDEGRPSCGFCKEAAIQCVYREVPPPKQDRTLLQILQRLDQMEANMNLIAQALPQKASVSNASDEHDTTIDDENGPSVQQGTPTLAGLEPRPGEPAVISISGQPPRENGTALRDARRSSTIQSTTSDAPSLDEDTEPRPADLAIARGKVTGEQGELTIPIEHDTAAHKLLRWPSIRKLVSQVTQDEAYVTSGEERRGTIRVYGRGECNFRGDAQGPRGSFDETAYGGEHTPSAFPCVALSVERAWGPRHFPAVDPRRWPGERIGGLNADGSLKLDTPTMMRLFDSFMQNIHLMHPFINRHRLKRMVHDFSVEYGYPPEPSSHSPHAMPGSYEFDGRREGANSSNSTGKRKRSTTQMDGSSLPLEARSTRPPEPPSAVTTAIVLLVAALGKICEHKEFLPALPTDQPTFTSASSPSVYGVDAPSHRTSPASSHLSGFASAASPQDTFTQTRQRPGETPNRSAALNVDVVPGLAYYAEAANILGVHCGNNELPHVQALLLAGLYMGQIARVMESWKWISYASQACLFIIRPKQIEGVNAEQKSLSLIAFWTCLQLESDILAELDLPASGITRFEETMPFPEFLYASYENEETINGMYYVSQTVLRKLLNRVHKYLYKSKSKEPGSSDVTWSTRELEELEYQLQTWRQKLPPPLQWDDNDPPPRNINAARLRAKYWGARYIIHRPFLHNVLHPPQSYDPSVQPSPTILAASHATSPAAGGKGHLPPSRPMAPPTNAIDERIRQACRNCIDAAFQSTQAFHGIPETHRPIVTNIFGTAHAQFGNLLVLSVAAKSPLLRDLVPQDKFDKLLRRTIGFLKSLGNISPTLRQDSEILERSLLPPGSQTASFSSTDGRY